MRLLAPQTYDQMTQWVVSLRAARDWAAERRASLPDLSGSSSVLFSAAGSPYQSVEAIDDVLARVEGGNPSGLVERDGSRTFVGYGDGQGPYAVARRAEEAVAAARETNDAGHGARRALAAALSARDQAAADVLAQAATDTARVNEHLDALRSVSASAPAARPPKGAPSWR